MTVPPRYYRSGNYRHYLERGERVRRGARELDAFLGQISLRSEERHSLDFGCGVGFMAGAMRELGWPIIGYDVDADAVRYGREKLGIDCLTSDAEVLAGDRFHLVLALDVLEHIAQPDLFSVLGRLVADWMLARIPVTLSDGGPFVLGVSEADRTHVVRLTKETWLDLLKTAGYTTHIRLDLLSFYETDGVLCRLLRSKGNRCA